MNKNINTSNKQQNHEGTYYLLRRTDYRDYSSARPEKRIERQRFINRISNQTIKRVKRPVITWRKMLVSAVLLVFAFGIIGIYLPKDNASALNQGDGILMYGESTGSSPKWRSYQSASEVLGSELTGSAAAANVRDVIIKASPTTNEMIALIGTSGGVLYAQRWNGTEWSAEWNVTVGLNNLSRFDVAYEQSSGEALVVYSGNVATTNELRYNLWDGTSWSGATNLDPIRTSGTVDGIKLVSLAGTNEIGLAWGDTSFDLSADFWDGATDTWKGEPAAALSTSLSKIGAATSLTSWSFSLAFESTSGELVVGWGTDATSDPTFVPRTAGPSGTWGSNVAGTAAVEEVTDFEMCADPNSDYIGWINLTEGSTASAASPDQEAGIWDGSALLSRFNGDTAAGAVNTATKNVSCGWVASGGQTRFVYAYDDAPNAWGINYHTWNKNSPGYTIQPDYNGEDFAGGEHTFEKLITNPLDDAELMYIFVDANSDLFVKRLRFDGTNFNWITAEPGAVTPETSVSLVTGSPVDYAFNAYISQPTYTQSSYRCYRDDAGGGLGTAIAAENSTATLPVGTPSCRLRINANVDTVGMPALSEQLKLQFATSTGGTWYDVGELSSWWNSSWLNRKKITFNNSAATENLTDFPVLITLDSSNIDYSKTKNAGEDIRFVDNDGTLLKHEIEKWNESGTSVVWVKVQQVDLGSATDYIHMYYNNTGASDGQDPTNVWTSFKSVWHLKEDPSGSAPQLQDSTSTNNDGTSQGTMTTGDLVTAKIGDGLDFDGTNDYISTANLLTSTSYNTITMEGWFKTSTASGKKIFGWEDTQTGTTSASYSRSLYMRTTGNATLHTYDTANKYAASPLSQFDNQWHYIVGVLDPTNTNIKVYIDGNLHATTTANATENINGYWRIAGYRTSITGGVDGYFPGLIDEMRVDGAARTASWIKSQYLSMNNTFNSYGGEQSQSMAVTFKDNTNIANGGTLSGTVLTNSDVVATYQESNITSLNPNNIAVDQIAEWDFLLDFTNAAPATSYYFRLVENDGTAFSGYTNYAHIVTPPQPDNIMRHGAWFLDGVEQSYYLADP